MSVRNYLEFFVFAYINEKNVHITCKNVHVLNYTNSRLLVKENRAGQKKDKKLTQDRAEINHRACGKKTRKIENLNIFDKITYISLVSYFFLIFL